MITTENRIFDTRFDTKKIFVTMNYKLRPRKYKDKYGKSLVYLDVWDKKDRIRLNTEIKILRNDWDSKSQRVKKTSADASLNIVFENIESKITQIKTHYLLRRKFLSAKILVEEFQSNTPDFDFISFFRHHLALQNFKKQTIKNHNAVLKKLENFRKEIPFHTIDAVFFKKYREKYNYNAEITYHSDLKCIKKYLRIAVDEGFDINIKLEKLKVNVTSNKIVYLYPEEVNKLLKYFFNEFIQESHILPLGYFLFSCYTGLRISDIQKRNRPELLNGIFTFNHKKTNNFQQMRLNDDAKKMLLHCEELFVVKLSDQKINKHLKSIAKICDIDKNITMHVGRHTFATTFYRNTKDIFRLKKLLGHSKIENTMVYVHLIDDEHLEGIDQVTY